MKNRGYCCCRRRVTNRNRIRKLEIFTAPTKAKSLEPAYSQALIQNKIDRQRSDPESQAVSQTAMVDGVWSRDEEECWEKGVNETTRTEGCSIIATPELI